MIPREQSRSTRVFWARTRIYLELTRRWFATLFVAIWHMAAGAIVAFPVLLLAASAAWVVV